MGKEKPIIIALDIGSSHVRALAARETLNGSVEILSTGEAPSLGVQRGVITNVDEASFAIKAALEDARVDGRMKQSLVYATVGGKHLASQNNYGEVRVSRSDSLVNESDVNRAAEAARGIRIGADTQIVHAIPRSYRVGGYVCRRNPLGMRGPTVGADTHVITAPAAAIDDLYRALQMAGKEANGLYAGGIAAAHAVLTPEEMENGAVLIDIGGGTTDVVAYSGGTPFHSFVLPVGGNQIAGDLAIALNTPAHVAERLLLEEGSAIPAGVDLTDELMIRCFGPTGSRTLRRAFLIEVIRLRVEEILRMAFVQAAERAQEPFEGNVVLTGGVANLKGIEALAAGVLETPVRVGRPVEDPKEPTELANPSFAAAIGIIRIATEPGLQAWKAAKERRSRVFKLWPVWGSPPSRSQTEKGAQKEASLALATKGGER